MRRVSPILEGETVVGILTRRDCRFEAAHERKVAEVMTTENLVTAPPGTSLEDARNLRGGHADPGITDFEQHPLAFLVAFPRNVKHDFPVVGELRRITEQVEQGLP